LFGILKFDVWILKLVFQDGGFMDIKQQIKDAIVKLLKIKPEELKNGVSLENSIGVDSTEMVEMVIALGKSFNVKIDTKEITKSSTLEDIERVVKEKLG
jgi:acyl carrier protein